MVDKISDLERRIEEIEARNTKVGFDKAWETSWTRRGLLALFTYLAIGIYMWAIAIERPWLNAIVPTVGFMLSTLTLPFFKSLWVTNQKTHHSTEKNF